MKTIAFLECVADGENGFVELTEKYDDLFMTFHVCVNGDPTTIVFNAGQYSDSINRFGLAITEYFSTPPDEKQTSKKALSIPVTTWIIKQGEAVDDSDIGKWCASGMGLTALGNTPKEAEDNLNEKITEGIQAMFADRDDDV